MNAINIVPKKNFKYKILLCVLLTVIMTFGMVLTASAAGVTYCHGSRWASEGIDSTPANGTDYATIIFYAGAVDATYPISFSSDLGTFSSADTRTDWAGYARAYLKSSTPGWAHISIRFKNNTYTCSTEFTKLPDPTVTLTAYNTTHTPNGTSRIVADVKRNGWGVSNVPITFTTDGGSLLHKGTLNPTTTQYTDSNGEATVTLTMPVQDTARVTGTLSATYGSVSNYCTITFSDGDGQDYPGTYHKVYYNGNGNTGGSVPIDGNSYTQNAWVYVLGNTGGLYRTGYGFAGWTTNSAGSGTIYNAGNKYTMGSSDVTFYAKWTGNPVTVTYAPNGGTVSPTSQTKLYGSTYGKGADGTTSDAMPIPTWTGHTFNGWFNSSGSLITNDTTVANPSAHTLTAQWTLIPTYTVTYDSNGATGIVPVDGKSYYQNDSVTVLDQGGLSKTNYNFAGWKHPNGTIYQANQTFAMGTDNVTLTAQWTANPTYTVTYDSNGATGTVPVDSKSYYQNDSVTVLDQGSLSKTNYTFAGWKHPNGNTYTAGQYFTMGTANVILTAQWTLIPTYTVTYDGNGASGSVPADGNHYVQGASVTVLGTGSLSNVGYTFTGWKHPDGTIYQINDSFTMGTADVTLTALWQTIPTTYWTVTFDGKGGSPAISTAKVKDGDKVDRPNNPTRSSYDFAGWYLDTNYDILFDFDTPISSDITLYARWTSTNPGGESFPIFSATPSFFEQFESYWF